MSAKRVQWLEQGRFSRMFHILSKYLAHGVHGMITPGHHSADNQRIGPLSHRRAFRMAKWGLMLHMYLLPQEAMLGVRALSPQAAHLGGSEAFKPAWTEVPLG